jgi:hypothetical protein
MDKLTQDSTMPLEQHLQDVTAAIAAATEKEVVEKGGAAPAAASASSKEDPLVDAIITSPIKVASMFMALRDGLAGGTTPAPVAKSQFMLGGGQEAAKPAPIPLVPRSYSEKKDDLSRARKASGKKKPGDGNITVSERATLAGNSLTGTVTSDKKTVAIKGANVAQAARQMGLGGLVDELNLTLQQLQGDNRYEKNTKRLEEDARKGSAPAKKLKAQRAPEMPTAPSGEARSA